MDLYSAAKRLSRPRTFASLDDRKALGIGDHGVIRRGRIREIAHVRCHGVGRARVHRRRVVAACESAEDECAREQASEGHAERVAPRPGPAQTDVGS